MLLCWSVLIPHISSLHSLEIGLLMVPMCHISRPGRVCLPFMVIIENKNSRWLVELRDHDFWTIGCWWEESSTDGMSFPEGVRDESWARLPFPSLGPLTLSPLSSIMSGLIPAALSPHAQVLSPSVFQHHHNVPDLCGTLQFPALSWLNQQLTKPGGWSRSGN